MRGAEQRAHPDQAGQRAAQEQGADGDGGGVDAGGLRRPRVGADRPQLEAESAPSDEQVEGDAGNGGQYEHPVEP